MFRDMRILRVIKIILKRIHCPLITILQFIHHLLMIFQFKKCNNTSTFKKNIFILDVQLCFRRFFSEIRGFIIKNWLYIFDSKYCPSLATTFSHVSGSVRIPRRKNWSSFEAIHESIQFFISLSS